MPSGYKVRLADGSEIGPLDAEMLRSWYERGLIEDESPVLAPGSRRWTSLSQTVDLRAWGVLIPRKKKRKRPSETAAAEAEVSGAAPARWRTYAAAVLLFLGAAGAGAWALFPGTSLPDLDGAPWKEIALVQVVLALGLALGWALARRLVRVAVFLISFAVFPVTGILVAQGLRGRVLLVLFCVWVLTSGLVALLAGGSLSRLQSSLSLLAAASGLAGAAYFAYVPPGVGHRRVHEQASSQRRFLDEGLGLRAQLPEGWYVLDKWPASDVARDAHAPADARLLLAHPRLGALGFLLAEMAVRDVVSAEEYLGVVTRHRRKLLASFKELERGDIAVGPLPGRALAATWNGADGPFREMTAAWRDGWNGFALVAWAPEMHSARLAEEFRSLVGAFVPSGREAARLQRVTGAVSEAVPHLSSRAVELLLAPAAETTLEPSAAYRRAWEAAARSQPSLDPAEAQELVRMDALVVASLEKRDRPRFLAYLERVRSGRPTTPEEDAEMSGRMRATVEALPETSRARVRALYEKCLDAARKVRSSVNTAASAGI